LTNRGGAKGARDGISLGDKDDDDDGGGGGDDDGNNDDDGNM
jgi:hypothetical protein